MILNQWNRRLIELTVNKFPYTNVIGLSRSVVACGTLLTLLLNPMEMLFPHYILGEAINTAASSEINKYNFFLILGEQNASVMKVFAILVLAVVISGYFSKITSILHWWICISFLYISSIIDGGDQMAANLALFLIPICWTDPRKNHWHTIEPTPMVKSLIGIITIWFIRLQVAIIYFQACVGKFVVKEWSNGTALYYWLNHTTFGMPVEFSLYINRLLANFYVETFLNYSVLFIEILLFLGFNSSIKYRLTMLKVGLVFHFLIVIFHGIFSFYFSIGALLIIYLYPTYYTLNLEKWFPKKLRFYST